MTLESLHTDHHLEAPLTLWPVDDRPGRGARVAGVAGGPVEVLPAVFHALWPRQPTTDLNTPLHERVLAGPRHWSGLGKTGGAG
ncbi:hypothetical protein ACGFZB_26040 [Streptomyces cinerochromogenes]|uniref:Uncharacterized protein n=1 Tax=Streptomyces cinerochromogenes TaxID=66422 RepID=A0ABW7BDK1_9ACTN